MRRILSLCLLAGLLIAFPASPAAASGEPDSLKELSGMKRGKLTGKEREKMLALRPQVQKDAAMSAAIKAGTRWRYERILEEAVKPYEPELDALFNFSPLLITEGAVTASPPVVARAGAALRITADGKVNVQKGSYKFMRSAAIVTRTPTWRDYLYFDPGPTDEIHISILPADGQEASRWRLWVNEGWELGVEQAEALFSSNVARLVRDYKGMLTYYGLWSVGMIEKPVIKETRTGTVIEAKEVIYDRSLYEMTGDGKFKKAPVIPKSSIIGVKAASGKKAGAAKAKPVSGEAPPPPPARPDPEPDLSAPLPPSVKPLTAQESGCVKSGAKVQGGCFGAGTRPAPGKAAGRSK